MGKTNAVATILTRELSVLVDEWLKRVKLVPELAFLPLDDEDRSRHLPKVFHDIVCRLSSQQKNSLGALASALAHGKNRRRQGYSPAMLVEESRVLQVVTFQTLHLHRHELDHEHLLLDVMVIADEIDWQLTQAVASLTELQLDKPAA